MILRRLSSSAAIVAFLGVGVAFAAGAVDSDVGIDFRKNITLTPQETLTQAKDYYKKMMDVQKRVLMLQAKAKKDKDVVKLNCVDDKLTQIRGHLTVSDQSMASLQSDVARGDDAGRQHQFTRLTILYQKVVTLGTEAEQCIGEDVSYIGATRVDVEIDPSIPPTDPTEPPLPVPDVQRPPEASPFV